MAFFVYSGYVGEDNYDSENGPTHTLRQFATAEEVLQFRRDFDELTQDGCAYVFFRIIEGDERKLVPKETVIAYQLA